MPAGTARKAVILVASESDERCEQLGLALAAAEFEVVQVPDVYLALGELVANSHDQPAAIVVQANCLDGSETEFFPLARRTARGAGVYILNARAGEERIVAAAVAAGAIVLDAAAAEEWVASLHVTERAPETVAAEVAIRPPEAPAEPAFAPRLELRERAPDPTADESPEPDEPEPATEASDALGPESAPAAMEEVPSEAELSAPATDSDEQDETASEAPGPAENASPAPSADLRIARPIEIPASWCHGAAQPEPTTTIRPEDDGVIPAVPWHPPSSRPTRTPPNARGIEHTPTPAPPAPPSEGLELTREELDALLGDPADPPDLRRSRR